MHAIDSHTLFTIKSDVEFNLAALKIFNFQYQNNPVYKAFVQSLKVEPGYVTHFTQIPFLPISFFKTQEVRTGEKRQEEVVFMSSTTTAQVPSKHFVSDITLYEKSFMKAFEMFYGDPKDLTILALLPGYLERQGSSLVYMFDKLIKKSESRESGFFLNEYKKLGELIVQLKKEKKKTLLIGVTYALLDLTEMDIELDENFSVMETGGMKGKRKELLKEELHSLLKEKLNIPTVHSEYGMTELLSQAYSRKDGIFECPPWMKILVRDVDDPLTLINNGRTGGINVIDFANLNSCSFIATQDLGKVNDAGNFELMGRFDNSDIRGCNLMLGS